MAIWLYGDMAIWLYGYMAIWISGYIAGRVGRGLGVERRVDVINYHFPLKFTTLTFPEGFRNNLNSKTLSATIRMLHLRGNFSHAIPENPGCSVCQEFPKSMKIKNLVLYLQFSMNSWSPGQFHMSWTGNSANRKKVGLNMTPHVTLTWVQMWPIGPNGLNGPILHWCSRQHCHDLCIRVYIM